MLHVTNLVIVATNEVKYALLYPCKTILYFDINRDVTITNKLHNNNVNVSRYEYGVSINRIYIVHILYK